ncbi:MAG: SOS response-associated peptidase, partial [Moraxellaceae bacterium]
MCFHSKQSADAQRLKKRYKASFPQELAFQPSDEVNGFTHPHCPIITNTDPTTIQLASWGLIPALAKDTTIQNSTLNAKIETLHEKPSFQAVVNQRCLVPVTGFYEWHWLDSKGKHKEKYLITCEASEIFSFAGLWSTWIDPNTGMTQQSFAILTTAANELMAAVHNSAKRMPIIITPTAEEEWLLGTHAP